MSKASYSRLRPAEGWNYVAQLVNHCDVVGSIVGGGGKDPCVTMTLAQVLRTEK